MAKANRRIARIEQIIIAAADADILPVEYKEAEADEAVKGMAVFISEIKQERPTLYARIMGRTLSGLHGNDKISCVFEERTEDFLEAVG